MHPGPYLASPPIWQGPLRTPGLCSPPEQAPSAPAAARSSRDDRQKARIFTCVEIAARRAALVPVSPPPQNMKRQAMPDPSTDVPKTTQARPAREWARLLAAYREPDTARSVFELVVTLGPFLGLWALAWWSMSLSYWLTLGLSLVNAGFLLRLFAIQHDCGHGAFFQNRTLSDWLGRVIGVLTLTPYD